MATTKKRTNRRRKRQARSVWRNPLLGLAGLWQRWPWRQTGLAAGFALAVLAMLALVAPGGGAASRGMALFLRRSLGWAAYLLPPAAAAGLYWFGIRRRGLDVTRSLGALVMLLALLGLTHLVRRLPNPFELSVAGYGGGIFGWALAALLLGAVGRVGAYLFAVALLLIGALLAFDLSLARARSLWSLALGHMPSGQPAPAARRMDLGPAVARTKPRRAAKPRPAPPQAAEPAPITPARVADVPAKLKAASPTPVPLAAEEAATPAEQPGEMALSSAPGGWQLPDARSILLVAEEEEVDEALLRQRARLIEDTLQSLGVPAEVVDWTAGPTVTQFAIKPGSIARRGADGQVKHMRVRVAQIAALADDLALALSASPVRIQAPIPDRSAVGVEVPNPKAQVVTLGSVFFSPQFQKLNSPLALALGRDNYGQPVAADLDRMPHLLMAGATNSGKSICINSLICCLLARNTPATLRLALVDPKRVELVGYNGLPHLMGKVAADAEEALGVLKWATREMDRRYKQFSECGARDLRGYNDRIERQGGQPLPRVVVVIDELAELMMTAAYEVERGLCRLAQMARATGIHLIVATQRPSVDVVTGLIKANFPARIAFAVAQQVDSRVILDTPGADKLLGRGDMLYLSPTAKRLIRAQGCFVSDEEIAALVGYWRRALADAPESADYVQAEMWRDEEGKAEASSEDALLAEALEVVKKEGRASTTMLQRHLRIGYTRASRLIDSMVARGAISAEVDGPFASRSLIAAEPPVEAEPVPAEEGKGE